MDSTMGFITIFHHQLGNMFFFKAGISRRCCFCSFPSTVSTPERTAINEFPEKYMCAGTHYFHIIGDQLINPIP